MNIVKSLSVLALFGILQGCSSTMSDWGGWDSWGYNSYWYYTDDGDRVRHYRGSWNDNVGGGYYRSRPIHVRKSYHFENKRTPTAHKTRDLQWIKEQVPSDYTIEVGNSGNRADIAKKLHKSPKNNRGAQFKRRGSDSGYTGVYGTFKSKEAAQKALKGLPNDVRGSAKIKHWGKVQSQAPEARESSRSRPVGPASVSPEALSTDY